MAALIIYTNETQDVRVIEFAPGDHFTLNHLRVGPSDAQLEKGISVKVAP